MNVSLFYLIGYMKSYAGGFSINESIYQRISFVGDDFTIDTHLQKTFKKLIKICEKALDEANLNHDITIEYWDNEKGGIIYSKNIVTLICDFFKSKDCLEGDRYLILDEYIFEDFEWREEDSLSHQQRLMFLSGAFDSHGKGKTFYFYNDYSMCLLVHNVLRCFSDEDDTIEMKSYFKTPQTDTITLNEDAGLWDNLK